MWRAAILLFLLSHAHLAHAHGLGGAALKPLVGEGTELHAVQLTTGVAIEKNGRWFYLCDALWGGVEQPAMASFGGAFPVWIAGGDVAYRFGDDGAVEATEVEALSAGRTLAMGGNAEGIYAISAAPEGGSELWVVRADGEAERLLTWPTLWTTLALQEGQVHVASSIDSGGILWRTYSPTGALEGEQTLFAESGHLTSRLVASGGSLFLITNDGFAFTLSRLSQVGAQTLLVTESPPQGLVVDESTVLITLDQQLQRVSDSTATPLTSTLVECLGDAENIGRYGCMVPDLWGVSASGPTDLLFDMNTLEGPLIEGLPPELAARCALDWRHFTDEADLSSGLPEPPPEPAPDLSGGDAEEGAASPGCGCGVMYRQRRGSVWWVGLIFGFWFVRRKYLTINCFGVMERGWHLPMLTRIRKMVYTTDAIENANWEVRCSPRRSQR